MTGSERNGVSFINDAVFDERFEVVVDGYTVVVKDDGLMAGEGCGMSTEHEGSNIDCCMAVCKYPM